MNTVYLFSLYFQGFSRDSSWLAGTALSLVYNLFPESAAENLTLFLKQIGKCVLISFLQYLFHYLVQHFTNKNPFFFFLEWNSAHNDYKIEIVCGIEIMLPNAIDGAYSQISLINGLLSVASEWLLSSTIDVRFIIICFPPKIFVFFVVIINSRYFQIHTSIHFF